MEKVGSSIQVRQDGLIVMRPKRVAQARGFFPIRGIAVLMLFFFAFKGYLMASLPEAVYADRLATLRGGTFVEQVGASLMQPDAVAGLFAGAIVDLQDHWRGYAGDS